MRTHDYQPPDADDYANVTELNHAWLRATTGLRGPQRARLAAAPFLLFSLREHDLEWWRDALDSKSQADWLCQTESAPNPIRRIQSAALGFIWQLARRNPYAARLVSGAGVTWCELLTSVPIVALIERVADRPDMTLSRLDRDATTSIEAACTSERAELRRSSHLGALQSMLTTSVASLDEPLRSAACRMPRARLRVADQLKE